MSSHLLVVDDDEIVLQATKIYLEGNGFQVDLAREADDAIEKVRARPHHYSLVILDYRMGGRDGDSIAGAMRALNPDIYILMFSADPSRDAVKAAWKAGALEFLDKSVEPAQLLETVRGWCRKYDETNLPVAVGEPAENNNEALIASLGMVGRSAALADVARKVTIYRGTPRNVLVLGESGTGKELVARALHRPGAEWRAVNCASYRANPTLLESILFGHVRGAFTGADKDRPGIFEEAAGGTVFLDEIHHLSPDVQVSLLRALQERRITRIGSTRETPVKFRLVAAAKPDLADSVEGGEFRLDLYYRIKGSTIVVPPLRDRASDIGPLVAHFCRKWIEENGRKKAFLARTVRYLESYGWPGNVRELENVVYELLDLSSRDKITPEDLDPKFFLPARASSHQPLRERLRAVEREHIRSVIGEAPSLREAARRMKISAPSLLRLLRKHELTMGGRTDA